MATLHFVLTGAFRRACTMLPATLSLILLVACDQYYTYELVEPTEQKERTHLVQKGDTLYSIAWLHNMDYQHLATLNGIVSPYRIYPKQLLSLGIFSEHEPPFPVQPAVAPVAEAAPEKANEKPSQPASKPSPVLPTSGPKSLSKNQTVKPFHPADEVPKNKTTVSTANTAAGKRKTIPNQSGATKSPAKTRGTNHSRLERTVAWHHGVAWSWPATGKLIAGFNRSEHANGIKISGDPDNRVHAAASGHVVYSGRGLRHYGALLLIKHSANYFSAYALNSQLLVKEGAFVKAGELIAIMGTDGRNRPVFYFEIRFRGKPLDPLKILSQRNHSS